MSFSFTILPVDLSQFSQADAFLSALNAAVEDWSLHLSGLGTIEIQIEVVDTGVRLAQTHMHLVDLGSSVFQVGTITELKTGTDPNQISFLNAPDIVIQVSRQALQDSVIDNGLWLVEQGKRYDTTTILRHELGHAFGITSQHDPLTGVLNNSEETVWDKFIQFHSDGSAWFTGPNASALYGGEVPVTLQPSSSDFLLENYNHLGNNQDQNLSSDLMSGLGLEDGITKDISELDLAILMDVGAPVVDLYIDVAQMNNISGSNNSDKIYGLGGNDVIAGGAGDDFIYGGDGTDTAVFQLDAGFYDIKRYGDKVTVANKFLVMDDGTDTLYGVELLKFNDKTIPVFNNPELPDLSAGTSAGGNISDGGIVPAGGGSSGSEGSGTPVVGETIIGTDASEYLSGTSGPDVIRGNGGDDILTGYGGQDSFDGGSGSDTVDYSYEPAGVPGTIHLAEGAGTADFPGFYTEQLTSIENIWMGAGDDVVYGDSGNNDLRGGPGDDFLEGGLGNDIIYGDWKYSDHGGNDTAILSYTFGAGYYVLGSPNALHIIGAEGDDWYYNIENFQFAGGVSKTATQVLQSGTIYPAAQTIESVSKGTDPARDSYNPSITSDARYVAFTSDAKLVLGDTNSSYDVFVFDRVTNTIERASVANDGTEANAGGYAYNNSISDDGRYVAFQSSSSNLVTGDTNATADIFLLDRLTRTLERISVASDGTQGNGSSYLASISADGRYVVFESSASNLVTGDTNGKADVFIFDRVTHSLELASGGISNFGGAAAIFTAPVLNADGRYVVFEATILQANGSSSAAFVHDRSANTTVRIPVPQGYLFAINPAISGDGRYIAFEAVQDNVFGAPIKEDVFCYDQQTQSTVLISASSDGSAGNGFSQLPSISADGRFISYSSAASNLITNDTDGTYDIFVYDRATQGTQRVSVGNGGVQGNGGSIESELTPDGRFIAFTSLASNFDTTDINTAKDVFIVDRQPNGAPIAEADAVTTNEGSPALGNVLIDNGNGADSDPDGDALAVVAINDAAINFGHTLTLASGALLVVNPDGRFVYDPNGKFDSLNPGEAAGDSFSYTISDGQGHTSSATVNLTIDGIVHGLQITGGSGILNGTSADDQIAGGPGNEIIRGGAGYDWLQGGPGNDTLFGDDGSDILNGDAGLDSIRGGSGADIFIFGAAALADAHSATPIIDTVADYDQGNTVTYGASEGDLIDLSSVLSTAHAGGQHVPALVRAIADSGNTFAKLEVDSDGAGSGHTWTDIARLDGLSALADVTVLVDTSVTATITVAAASGIMIVENSDGTHTGYRWDLADQNSWSDSMTTYTSQGSAQNQTTNYDDDTHTVQTWDVLNQNTWADYVWSYDPAWHAISQTVSYDDGTRTEQTWDVLSQNTWSDYVWSYDAQGRTAIQFVNYDDNIHTAQYWDAADSEPWSSWVGYYDLQQRESAHFVNMDDGTRTGQYWDVEGKEAWSTWAGYYDSQNSETTHFVTMDDGSRTAQYFDVSGQYNWSNFVYTYDDQNRLTSQTVIYDDSTRKVQYWDAANTRPWATIVEVYAANGAQTSRTVYNDDGSHIPPVVLDLDGNGIDVTPLSASTAWFDMSGTGERLPTAWVGGHDGLLAIDLGANGQAGPDGVIDQAKEINFTLWAPGTTSDLQALRQVFDTDHDGKLDAGDTRWNDFRVWINADSDGVSKPSELKTLSGLGITSIDLDPSPSSTTYPDGSAIQGLASFTRTDGSTGLVGDVALAYGTRASGPAVPNIALLGSYMASEFASTGHGPDGSASAGLLPVPSQNVLFAQT